MNLFTSPAQATPHAFFFLPFAGHQLLGRLKYFVMGLIEVH